MSAEQLPARPPVILVFLEVITKLALMAGGIFAAWEYWEAKKDARIARATTYFERFENGEVGDARRRINGALRPYVGQLQMLDPAELSFADRDRIILAVVEENGGQIASDIDTIIDYFQGVSICVSAQLCERSVVELYFAESDAPTLWNNFEPYIRARRVNNPKFASAFEKLAAERVAAPE